MRKLERNVEIKNLRWALSRGGVRTLIKQRASGAGNRQDSRAWPAARPAWRRQL